MTKPSSVKPADALLQGSRLSAYSSLLCDWYEQNARPLPWRMAATPYHVWISEIMLQQTRIEAVLPHYAAFIAAYPDVKALAEAPWDELMKQWEGLGYYSRAKNLQKAAQRMMTDFCGDLPCDYGALLSLPGIGEYTAGAIASIAFGIPVTAVDGNVLRVLARLTGEYRDVLSPEGKAWFSAVAAEMLDIDRPGTFNSAMMELGERVCLPNTVPKCGDCPLADACIARKNGCAAQLPVRIKKAKRREEQRSVAVVLANVGDETRVLLRRRPETGLLAGLWELPNVEGTPDDSEWRQMFENFGGRVTAVKRLPDAQHVFTHITWKMSGLLLWLSAPVAYPDGEWVTLAQLQESYALPSAFRAYAQLLPLWMTDEKEK